MRNYNICATFFGLICCLLCLRCAHYKLENRLDQLNQQFSQLDRWVEEQKNSPPQHIVSGHWVGAYRKEPRKNAAMYVPFEGYTRVVTGDGAGPSSNPVIQIMDGQYSLANFAITVHKGEVVMQLIQDGEIRCKKLWELTDESDFVRVVK